MGNNIIFGVMFIFCLNLYTSFALSDNTPPVSVAFVTGNRFTLQAATYGSEEYGRQDALLLKSKGFNAFLIHGDKYWWLCIGNFKNEENAEVFLKKLPSQYQHSHVRIF